MVRTEADTEGWQAGLLCHMHDNASVCRNEDVLKGKWKENKGRVKEKWGKFTDDDLAQSVATRGSSVLPLLKGDQGMTARRIIMFFVFAVFSLGLASPGLSAGVGEEVRGTVTKIEGGNVSIKDIMGSEKTVEPKNPEALTELKVGDRAMVKDGILTKEGGVGPSAPSPGPKY